MYRKMLPRMTILTSHFKAMKIGQRVTIRQLDLYFYSNEEASIYFYSSKQPNISIYFILVTK